MDDVDSSSNTSDASVGVYAALVGASLLWRSMTRSQSHRLGPGAWFLWSVAVLGCLLLLARPEIADRVSDFFSITLGRKLESSSGIERGSWNLQAWTNFLDLNGLGVGLGSARASSFALVLLSNLGALGTALFLGFIARVLIAPKQALGDAAAPVARASRHAVLAVLIAVCVSGTVFDLGLAFYAFAAAASVRGTQRVTRPSTGSTHATA